MIDLSVHLLPGFDDGAADEAEALEMARLAAASGVREIVAAPDVSPEFDFDPAEAAAARASLQEKLGERVFLHGGTRVLLKWSNIERVLEAPDRFTINGRKYLHVKLAPEMRAAGVTKVFDRFVHVGLIPIISYSHRATATGEARARLLRWIEIGCLIELRASALLGWAGEGPQEAAARLIDADAAHFVASRSRGPRRPPPTLIEAYRFIEARWGVDCARRLLIDNPWAVLWGQEIARSASRVRRSFSFTRMLGLRGTRRG